MKNQTSSTSTKSASRKSASKIAVESAVINSQEITMNNNTNASIVAEYQKELASMIGLGKTEPATDESHVAFTEVTVAGVLCHVRAHSVTIHADKKGGAIQLHEEYQTTGVLSAMTELHTQPFTNKYSTLEVGAQILNVNTGRSVWAGVVTMNYKGNNRDILAVTPKKGINIVGYRMGELYTVRHISTPVAPRYDEDTRVTKERQIFCKAEGFDFIMSGAKIQVAPFLKEHKKGEDNRWAVKDNGKFDFMYSTKRVEGFVKTYTDKWSVTPEQAASDRFASVVGAAVKHSDYGMGKKIAAAAESIENFDEKMLSLRFTILIEGEKAEVTAADVIGKELVRVVGAVRLNPITVDAKNVATLATNANMRNAVYELAS